MEIQKTLQPGDMGTKGHLKKYGNKLVCVRYRIDKLHQKRLTTVELVVNERTYIQNKTKVYVWLDIKYDEIEHRKAVKENGGIWLPEEKYWKISYELAKQLGLKSRIRKKFIE